MYLCRRSAAAAAAAAAHKPAIELTHARQQGQQQQRSQLRIATLPIYKYTHIMIFAS
jgi:hypothetical protein